MAGSTDSRGDSAEMKGRESRQEASQSTRSRHCACPSAVSPCSAGIVPGSGPNPPQQRRSPPPSVSLGPALPISDSFHVLLSARKFNCPPHSHNLQPLPLLPFLSPLTLPGGQDTYPATCGALGALEIHSCDTSISILFQNGSTYCPPKSQ